MKNKWTKRFIELADHVANWSKERKKVGAVIVDRRSNKVVSQGFNGLPKFMSDECLTSLSQEDKSYLALHAEHNALDQLSTEDYYKELDVYITHPPCKLCTLRMIHSLANIKTVHYVPLKDVSFNLRYNVKESLQLLRDNDIEVVEYDKEEHKEDSDDCDWC